MRIRNPPTVFSAADSQQIVRIGLVICCALVLGSVAAEGQESGVADVSGTWTLEVTLPDGDVFTGTLTLHQDASQISGTWQRDGAREKPRVRGEIKGKAITFFWILNLPARGDGVDAAVRMSFEGEVGDDTITGTASFGSRAEDLDWTAKRTS